MARLGVDGNRIIRRHGSLQLVISEVLINGSPDLSKRYLTLWVRSRVDHGN